MVSSIRRFRLISIFIFLFTTSFAITSQAADSQVSPQGLLQSITDEMIVALNENQAAIQNDVSAIYPLVDQILLPHVDFDEMSRRVMARYWNNATPDQRRRFATQFSRLLVRTYATAFKEFSGDESVDFTGTRRSRSNADLVEVESVVRQPGSPNIPVNYRLIRDNSGWKVYDVSVDGVSLVSNFRDQFRESFRRDGVEQVIDSMAERNAQLDLR